MNAQISSIQNQQVVPQVAEADSGFRRNHPGLLAILRFVALVSLAQSDAALAATAPSLGSTSTYGVVSSTFTNSNTAPQTIINGDVCFTTGPVTPPLTITGATVTPCPPATGVDQGLALADLNGQPCTFLGAGAIALDSVIVGTNPPGTIPPGCYSKRRRNGIFTLSTTVTLNGLPAFTSSDQVGRLIQEPIQELSWQMVPALPMLYVGLPSAPRRLGQTPHYHLHLRSWEISLMLLVSQ